MSTQNRSCHLVKRIEKANCPSGNSNINAACSSTLLGSGVTPSVKKSKGKSRDQSCREFVCIITGDSTSLSSF